MGAETDIEGVLLIEDNPGDAKLFEHHLDSNSFTGVASSADLTHVETLADGRAELRTGHYDVVFLDLGLPASSGLETLDRFMEVDPDVPVIVLTGLDDQEQSVMAIQRGAQDYLIKGEITGDTLARSLRYAVERRKHTRELARQKEQMEFFNSILRHDMLNALNVILARAEMLETDLDGDHRESAASIVSWSHNIIELTDRVRAVLDTLTSDSDLELKPIDLVDVIETEAQRVRQMADGVTVETDLPDRATVRADDLVTDVVGNVMTNAVEHNDTDAPELVVSVADPDDEGTITVRIADNGPGIPDAEKSRVLNRGETGHQSGGTGFGMYFANSMVEAYGGTVTITDNDPRGTIVELTIPTP
ncbi:MAG: ATP-binding protein [Halorientalis sp.]